MATHSANDRKYTIVVEHLDPELDEWQTLEYKCIAEESKSDGWGFLLSGLGVAANVQSVLKLPASNLIDQGVEALYKSENDRRRVCLLDPKAEKELSPEDGDEFDVFLFGGILGDDPPRDRTGELRKLGFSGRRLGREQMTTDTAARVTRLVIRDKQDLEDIPYVDRPNIDLPSTNSANEPRASESVSMPFRYIKREDGTPVMPKGMVELLANDADKDILDLL